jgi:hypothetical protein
MRKVPILIPVLALITILFLAILVFTYVETKKANPQMIETTSASAKRGCVLNAETRRTRSQRGEHLFNVGFPPRDLRVLRVSALNTKPHSPA